MKNVGINCRVMGVVVSSKNNNTYLQSIIFGLDILNTLFSYLLSICFFNTLNAKFDELKNNVMV